MPKYVKQDDPDDEYNQGHIRLVRLGSTIYLWLKGYAHPIMTRKSGDEVVAKAVFSWLKHGFSASLTSKVKKRSLWSRLRSRLRMLWWRLTDWCH